MKSQISILTLVILASFNLNAQDNCKDILEQGIFNTYQSSNAYSLRQNVYEFFSLTDEKKEEFKRDKNNSFFGQGSWIGQAGMFDALLIGLKLIILPTVHIEKSKKNLNVVENYQLDPTPMY